MGAAAGADARPHGALAETGGLQNLAKGLALFFLRCGHTPLCERYSGGVRQWTLQGDLFAFLPPRLPIAQRRQCGS